MQLPKLSDVCKDERFKRHAPFAADFIESNGLKADSESVKRFHPAEEEEKFAKNSSQDFFATRMLTNE